MKDIMYEQNGGIGLLHFSGDSSENCADKLRQGFMVLFESTDYVVVNFTKATELDIGCLNLFCTAHRIFTRCNKRLMLAGRVPKVFRARDESGRPLRPSCCVSECREGCLWNG